MNLRNAPRLGLALALTSLSVDYLSAREVEWELYWADEFSIDGAIDSRYWTHEIGGGGWGNQERQIYTDALENSRVENGQLLIQATQQGGSRAPIYNSARLITREKVAFQYGRIEVRAKLPGETGTWPAIWLLSNDVLVDGPFWPNNGEIDILETVGFERDPAYLQAIGQQSVPNVHATIHTDRFNFQDGSGGIGSTTFDLGVTDEFHIYALEWFPDRLDFFLDDDLYYSIRRDADVGIPVRNRPDDISSWWPFDQRYFLILNIAVGGEWGGSFNSDRFPTSPYGTDGINHAGDWPQTMAVDYVRIYRDKPKSTLTAPGVLEPEDYDREYGLRLAKLGDNREDLHFTGAETGDFAEYVVYAPADGIYTLDTTVRTSRAGTLELSFPEQNDGIVTVPVPSTNGEWSEINLGTVGLQRGANRLRVGVPIDAIEWSDLVLTLPGNGTQFGFTAYAGGVVDTGAWLGPVNLNAAPFVYVPKMRGWLYSPQLAGGAFAPESQYLYLYSPSTLGAFDSNTAPWFYSIELQRWFYAEGASSSADLNAPQWIYFLH